MGLLDPPADGVIGAVTRWALRAAGLKGELTAENANDDAAGAIDHGGAAANPAR